jgi:hypothetical protein
MRIDDVSPTVANFSGSLGLSSQSVSGKGLCLTLSDDGQRAYVGGRSGVWRSDDGGETWWHPEWLPDDVGGPTRRGALVPPNVYDLIIDPTDPDRVFAAAGRDGREPSQAGVYRSTDGAQNWTLVHQFVSPDGSTVGLADCLAIAPDDPRTLYAAGELAVALTTDGGDSWGEVSPDPNGGFYYHVLVGPLRPAGRRVYAIGSGLWYSLDGGLTWFLDPAPRWTSPVIDGGGPSSRTIALHPQDDKVVYVMQDDLTLWKGQYPDAPSTGPAVWTELPPPPIAGGADSGATFVVPHLADGEAYLYVSDRRSVHGVGGEPASAGDWTLLDAPCHVDPHAIALTSGFRQSWPDRPGSGRALLVNDGGVSVTTDGMQSWALASELSTLNVVNVGVSSVRDGPTAVTFGSGDNNGFSSADGGATWKTQGYLGGDNDCSFADPFQPTRSVVFAPRSKSAEGGPGEIYLYVSPDASPADTALGSPQLQRIPAPPPVTDVNGKRARGWNAVSYFFNYGYRPIVQTLGGEEPRPDSDLITIRFTGIVAVDPVVLLRTTALSTITHENDWVTGVTAEGPGVKAFQVGNELPDPLVTVVQGSGGHDNPTFYAGNAAPLGPAVSPSLWKLLPGATDWVRIVPVTSRRRASVGPEAARRFFVDPYRPDVVYVLATDHVYRSEDGGASWTADESLEQALTEDGAFPYDIGDTGNPADAILRDMQFDPYRTGFRLAAGVAGVFVTTDGLTWDVLLRSTAVAMQPTSITYDPVPCDRAVYVGTSGRGVLRLSPLPPDWEFPVGSVQAAAGLITLLRVHDLGTGYGPADDALDAEVVVLLDSDPDKAFGLQLRDDANRPAAEAMLRVLRDCFNAARPVRLDFIRTGCRTGQIVRVIEPT